MSVTLGQVTQFIQWSLLIEHIYMFNVIISRTNQYKKHVRTNVSMHRSIADYPSTEASHNLIENIGKVHAMSLVSPRHQWQSRSNTILAKLLVLLLEYHGEKTLTLKIKPIISIIQICWWLLTDTEAIVFNFSEHCLWNMAPRSSG